MRYYKFALTNGSGLEDLGGMQLADDVEAITFGKQVIQDLQGFAGNQYVRWCMDITEGERVVDTIAFELGPTRN
jgi:hypothetical protein